MRFISAMTPLLARSTRCSAECCKVASWQASAEFVQKSACDTMFQKRSGHRKFLMTFSQLMCNVQHPCNFELVTLKCCERCFLHDCTMVSSSKSPQREARRGHAQLACGPHCSWSCPHIESPCPAQTHQSLRSGRVVPRNSPLLTG